MRCVLIAASFGAAAAGVTPHPDRASQISKIADTPGLLWKPVANERFGSQAPGASKSLCGVKGNWTQDIEAAVARGEIERFDEQGLLKDLAIPDSFDSAENWPQCAKVIGDIRDQSNCGCCWAFAAAEAASDRMCIATNGALMFPLSAEDVCFCASEDGCDGGDIVSPWSHIGSRGAVTGGQYQGTGPFGKGMCSDFSMPHCHHHGPQKDDPYPAEGKPGCPSQHSARCPKHCDADASPEHSNFDDDKYTFRKAAGNGHVVTASGEKKIQQMIMTGGPVETAFTVYSDFENYDSGIYHHVTGEFAGGHAVKFVGWGVDNGVKYWKVANSWNPHWAEKGYFRIRRGNNEGGIEDSVVGSAPDAKWSKKSGIDATFVV